MVRAYCILALAAAVAAFAPAPLPVARLSLGAKKGFGDDKFSNKKPKSAAKVEKERASDAYDAAKATGVPEYRVFVRESGTEEWAPIGCVTVPRSESIAQSIFGNRDALEKASTDAYAGLRDGKSLDFGYNLACFPDEPVKLAEAEDAARTTNPFLKFAKDLTNPLNVG